MAFRHLDPAHAGPILSSPAPGLPIGSRRPSPLGVCSTLRTRLPLVNAPRFPTFRERSWEVSLQLLAVVRHVLSHPRPAQLPFLSTRSRPCSAFFPGCVGFWWPEAQKREPQLLNHFPACLDVPAPSALGVSLSDSVSRDIVFLLWQVSLFVPEDPFPPSPSRYLLALPLFVTSSGTTSGSDFPGPFVIGVCPPLDFPRRPKHLLPGATWDPPGFSRARCLRTCTGL